MMRKTAEEVGVSDLKIEIDRISELPESIIHHIFGLMRSTKDVVRTQLLSKNWKRVYDSYQTFDFDESWFLVHSMKDLERWKEELERFKEYVEKSLATRLDRLDCVENLRLHAKGFSDAQCMARCIRAAIAKNVKELDVDLGFPMGCQVSIDLTQSTSITSLKIRGELVLMLAAMKMCNLRKISFESIRLFDVNAMKKLEENCPLLEVLRLAHCIDLSHLNISSLNKLKRVEVKFCSRVEYIKIASPNLRTFQLFDNRVGRKLDLKCSTNLRILSLISSEMSDSAFEDCISMFPLLEKLELDECNVIEKPKICSLTLKWLALVDCSNLDRVEVDAPNLHSFHYIGRAMPFSFVNAPRLSEATFDLNSYSYYRRWDAKHENFFWNLDGSKGFKLLVYTEQNMKIVEDPREEDLYQTKDCMIQLTKSSSKVVKVLKIG